ncbi:MAG: hypothetical protein O9342_16855 [Beijerinckiaceae bacterium]|nr:hypothetical protein [Beijerinckiaceae bacterium]
MPSVCVEDGLVLAIHGLVAGALRSPADEASGSWIWSQGERQVASVSYRLERLGPAMARLLLRYTVDGEAMAYPITLVAEPCRFGGIRWFALCPRLGTRVAKLYLPPGGKRFLSRKAWRIAYRSQNASSTFDRLCLSRDRLLSRKLKSRDPDFPLKPKWMRRRTYEAHLERLDHLHTRMDVEMIRRFAPDVLEGIW